MRIDPDNVQRSFRGPAALEIQRAQEHHLDAFAQLHASQRLRHPRSRDEVYRYLIAWHSEPYVAIDRGGAAVGYLVAQPGSNNVPELIVAPSRIAEVIQAWIHRTGHPAEINLSPLQLGELHQLGRLSAVHWVQSCGNWRILRWAPVLRALLEARLHLSPMLPGTVAIAIEGVGGFELHSDGARSTCTPCPPDRASLRAPPEEMLRMLCGPLPPSRVARLPPDAALLDQWCPLPLYWAPTGRSVSPTEAMAHRAGAAMR